MRCAKSGFCATPTVAQRNWPRVGFQPHTSVENSNLLILRRRSCRWNRSNRRSRTQFRYRSVGDCAFEVRLRVPRGSWRSWRSRAREIDVERSGAGRSSSERRCGFMTVYLLNTSRASETWPFSAISAEEPPTSSSNVPARACHCLASTSLVTVGLGSQVSVAAAIPARLTVMVPVAITCQGV